MSLVNFLMSKEALTFTELGRRFFFFSQSFISHPDPHFFFLFPFLLFFFFFFFFCRVKSHQSAGNHMLIHTNEELLQTQVLIINDT